jgi:hypothetical protein
LGFRRSPDTVQAARVWRRFLDAQAALLRAAALPSAVTESRERWDDFLMHAYLDHHDDPSHFTVDKLDEAQYQALVQLTVAYLEAFYDGGERAATPIALRTEDQDALRARFAALR